MNAVLIVCSRQQCSRLPGKVFKRINGQPALVHLLNRVTGQGVPVVVAVPEAEREAYQSQVGHLAHVLTGDPESPLHRMSSIMADHFPDAHWLVRVTHDDVLIDMETVKDLIQICEMRGAGYGVCPSIVEGAGAEVIHRDNLLHAAKARGEATEFVSYFVRGEGLPRPLVVRMEPRASIQKPYRLTMDYPEDAQLLEIVLRGVGNDATVDEICAYLDARPWLTRINALPSLSVYTCAWNAERWVTDTVESVAQRKEVGEYVFVDDGSTDETVPTFYKHGSGRLILNEYNQGLASSSNRALSACRGKYVMRIDADDMMFSTPEDLRDMKELIQDGAHAVYPCYLEMDEEGTVLASKGSIHGSVHHHVGGAMFDKKFLDELRFKEGLRHWDGLELYERMKKAGAKIAYLDRVTWLYRVRRGSMSRSEPEQRASVRRQILGPVGHS